MKRRLTQAITILMLMVTVAACNNDNGGDGSTTTTQAPTTITEVATTTTEAKIGPAVLQALANAAQANPSSSTPTAQLSAQQYDELLAVLHDWQVENESVVSQLRDAGVLITSDDIAQFIGSVCAGNLGEALTNLQLRITSADLRALPAINHLLALVTRQCPISSLDLDILSNRLVHPLLAIEQLRRLRQSDTNVFQPNVKRAYESTCDLVKDRLADWVENKLKLGKDGGFLLALSLGALQTTCSSLLQDIVQQAVS